MGFPILNRERGNQMKAGFQKKRFILLCGLLVVSFSSVAYAGNECKIKYGWNTGNSLQGTFKNHSNTIYLDKGQTKTINKNRMNYVKNLKSRKVKFYLKNATDMTLGKKQRNPGGGTYVLTVKLKKVKCLNTSSGSSSSPNTSSSSNTSSGRLSYPCAAKTPAPPAPFVPIPYPCARK